MNKLFIPYELALLAKEKGFDEICFGYYNTDTSFVLYDNTAPNNKMPIAMCTAPLYQQIVDWFREKHKLHVEVEFDELKSGEDDEDIETYKFKINEQWVEGKDWTDYKYGFKHIIIKYDLPSYYEALNNAIEKAFKLI